ncbi:hypothetical protein ACFS7Z_25035 [Pontibacter toksunensis]|uniref:Uncharacterized protein n=1 Tax=Pontibacter toksunensis TaxID=1332631 RepID=A0ABW6C1B6_9BACT
MGKHHGATCHGPLECRGSLVGVEWHVVETVHPETGKVTGCWPAFKYHSVSVKASHAYA